MGKDVKGYAGGAADLGRSRHVLGENRPRHKLRGGEVIAKERQRPWHIVMEHHLHRKARHPAGRLSSE